MLFVPSPRYSEISRVFAPSTMTTPTPAGPGLPVHAPSVHTWMASAGADAAAAVPVLSAPRDFAPALTVPFSGAGSPTSISITPPPSGVRFRDPARYTFAPVTGL